MSDAEYLIQKLPIARRAIETARKVFAVLQFGMTGALVATLTLGAVRCPAQQLTNGTLSVTVNGQNGSYQFGPHWWPICTAGKLRCTGRPHVAACGDLSLAFGLRVAIQRCAWLRSTVDGHMQRTIWQSRPYLCTAALHPKSLRHDSSTGQERNGQSHVSAGNSQC
jgi:hypothetical protein